MTAPVIGSIPMQLVRPCEPPIRTSCPIALSASMTAAEAPSRSMVTEVGSHWWWSRAASTADWMSIPKSMRCRITSRTLLMMVRPPGAPTTATSSPSFATIDGVMLESMRCSGRARFGSVPMRPRSVVIPGAALKSPISLLSRNPPPGTVIFEPYQLSIV